MLPVCLPLLLIRTCARMQCQSGGTFKSHMGRGESLIEDLECREFVTSSVSEDLTSRPKLIMLSPYNSRCSRLDILHARRQVSCAALERGDALAKVELDSPNHDPLVLGYRSLLCPSYHAG